MPRTKTPLIQRWLARHPLSRAPYPDRRLLLNLVEGWFAVLTENQIASQHFQEFWRASVSTG
jgi:hypothetical protein